MYKWFHLNPFVYFLKLIIFDVYIMYCIKLKTNSLIKTIIKSRYLLITVMF